MCFSWILASSLTLPVSTSHLVMGEQGRMAAKGWKGAAGLAVLAPQSLLLCPAQQPCCAAPAASAPPHIAILAGADKRAVGVAPLQAADAALLAGEEGRRCANTQTACSWSGSGAPPPLPATAGPIQRQLQQQPPLFCSRALQPSSALMTSLVCCDGSSASRTRRIWLTRDMKGSVDVASSCSPRLQWAEEGRQQVAARPQTAVAQASAALCRPAPHAPGELHVYGLPLHCIPL